MQREVIYLILNLEIVMHVKSMNNSIILLGFYSVQSFQLINDVSNVLFEKYWLTLRKRCLELRGNNIFFRNVNTFYSFLINATNSIYENIKILFYFRKKKH